MTTVGTSLRGAPAAASVRAVTGAAPGVTREGLA